MVGRLISANRRTAPALRLESKGRRYIVRRRPDAYKKTQCPKPSVPALPCVEPTHELAAVCGFNGEQPPPRNAHWSTGARISRRRLRSGRTRLSGTGLVSSTHYRGSPFRISPLANRPGGCMNRACASSTFENGRGSRPRQCPPAGNKFAEDLGAMKAYPPPYPDNHAGDGSPEGMD